MPQQKAYSRPILRSTIERFPLLLKYTKLYFDAKSVLFHKNVPFLANIERCPNFLEFALQQYKSTYNFPSWNLYMPMSAWKSRTNFSNLWKAKRWYWMDKEQQG